ncbi:MAG: hypothetical protein CL489_00765 [Acidobacteria bacterium]|nr:hypothetical protein [Acidobacteriota bacterium]
MSDPKELGTKYQADIEIVLSKDFHFHAEDLQDAYQHAGKIIDSTKWKNFFVSFELKKVIVTKVTEEKGVLKEE